MDFNYKLSFFKNSRWLLCIVLIGKIQLSVAQIDQEAARSEIETFQNELNHEYSNEESSPLLPTDLQSFEGLSYFPIDLKYRLIAKFIRTGQLPSFIMKTTTDRKPVYDKYGEAHFKIDGREFVLAIYQSHQLRQTDEYKSYLFLPFTDQTNGNATYEGGRFIDLSIPDGETIIIDFNKAYNPYCAYNPKYSCPIPPKENVLNIEIMAGVRAFKN